MPTFNRHMTELAPFALQRVSAQRYVILALKHDRDAPYYVGDGKRMGWDHALLELERRR